MDPGRSPHLRALPRTALRAIRGGGARSPLRDAGASSPDARGAPEARSFSVDEFRQAPGPEARSFSVDEFRQAPGPEARAPLERLDIVPRVLLVPPDIPIRGGSRTDAAVVLDRELVALSSMDSEARRVQATLARHLIVARAWRALGFVRLGDYARELLGLSPRSLEEDAAAMRALDGLPLLRDAFASGGIGWSQVRLLVRAATPATEPMLLEKARSSTIRELERFLKDREPERDRRADDPQPVANEPHRIDSEPRSIDSEPRSIGNEPRSIDSEPVPRAGAPGTGADEPRCNPDAPDDDGESVRWNIDVSRSGRRLWLAAREYASRVAGAPLDTASVLELVAAEAMSGAPAASRDPSPRSLPSADDLRRRLLQPARDAAERGARLLLGFLAEAGVTEGFAWLDPASRDAGPAAMLRDLVEGADRADAFELDRRLRVCRLAMQRIDSQMAALLRIGIDRRLFRELGFATVKLYVDGRLRCCSRKAWSLVAIERAIWRSSPRLRDAWREGRISHLAASTLLPVIGEVHAEAWIERARTVTLRRLRDEVAWATDPANRPYPFHRPAPPPEDADVRIDGLADLSPSEVQMRAHGGDPDRDVLLPGTAVRLSFVVPVSVAVLVETAIWTLRRGPEPRWRTFERILAQALLEWTSAPPHRDPVFERDGWRCAVPGCSSRRNLHDHHLLFRSRGGDNTRDNRVTVCASHHLHGIHAGIVRARGQAPRSITWELGCQRDEGPLMRLLGDRFIS